MFFKEKLKAIVLKAGQNDICAKLPLVHFEFEQIRHKIETYLKFSDYNSKIDEKVEKLKDFSTLDLDSCIFTIDLFERDYQKIVEFDKVRIKLEHLINMIRNLISNTTDPSDCQSDKFAIICRKQNLFRFYYLLLNDVVLKNPTGSNYSSRLNVVFKEMIDSLKVKFIKDAQQLCFKTNKASISYLHEFTSKLMYNCRKQLFNYGEKSKCCGKERLEYKVYLTSECNCQVCKDCEAISKSNFANGKTVCMVCKKTIGITGTKFKVTGKPGEISIFMTEIPLVTYLYFIKFAEKFRLDFIY